MSVDDTTVSFSLEVNVEQAYQNVRRLQTVLNRSLSTLRRLTRSENLQDFYREAQRAIAIANELRLALASLQALRMAAGDPLAWAMAGVATAQVVISVADELELRSPEY